MSATPNPQPVRPDWLYESNPTNEPVPPWVLRRLESLIVKAGMTSFYLANGKVQTATANLETLGQEISALYDDSQSVNHRATRETTVVRVAKDLATRLPDHAKREMIERIAERDAKRQAIRDRDAGDALRAKTDYRRRANWLRTGWMKATLEYPCPTCSEPKGNICIQGSGIAAARPHTARVRASEAF